MTYNISRFWSALILGCIQACMLATPCNSEEQSTSPNETLLKEFRDFNVDQTVDRDDGFEGLRRLDTETNGDFSELSRNAEFAAKHHNYRTAAAAYLACAFERTRYGTFEQVQQYLKLASDLTPKLTENEKVDFIQGFHEVFRELHESKRDQLSQRALELINSCKYQSSRDVARKTLFDNEPRTVEYPSVKTGKRDLAFDEPYSHQIQVLLEQANQAETQKDCLLLISLIDKSISIFESLKAVDGSKFRHDPYLRFGDIRRRLARCGKYDEGTEYLWRLVRKRLELGFPDPDYPAPQLTIGGCFPDLKPKTADAELFKRNKNDNAEACQKFLTLAEESKNSNNVIVALTYVDDDGCIGHQRSLKCLEEIEKWRATGDQAKYAVSLLQTADLLVLEHPDEAASRINSAMQLAYVQTEFQSTVAAKLTDTLDRVATLLVGKNDLELAGKLYLQVFARRFKQNLRHPRELESADIEAVAVKMQDAKSLPGSEKLLQQALQIAEINGMAGLVSQRRLNLALAFLSLEKHHMTAAKTYYRRAIDLCKDMPDKTVSNYIQRSYAAALSKKGLWKQSKLVERDMLKSFPENH